MANSMKKRRRKTRRIKRTIELNYFLRNHPGMKEWREGCLEKYANKCAILNIRRKGLIHVHHIKPHHEIRDEVLRELGLPLHLNIKEYTDEQIQAIIDLYIQKHADVEGIPLLKKVHKLFHKLYGMKATLENYEEFKKRWESGEFS